MDKPIRILHLVPQMKREGIQNLLMNIYRNIDTTKIQFDFLIHEKKEGDFDKEILELGGKCFYLSRLSGKYFLLHYKNDLKKFFTKHKNEYEIIHSHLNTLSTFPLSIAKKFNIPTRIAHNHSSFFTDKGIKKIVKLYSKSQIKKYATNFFACSQKAGIFMFGKNTKFKIINNGIEIEKFLFNFDTRNKIRKNFSLNDSTILFVHSGGFRKPKNHLFLLEVFAKLVSFFPSAKLLLIGDGEEKEKIISKAKTLNVYDNIIFAGSIPNVYDYLSAGDAFIFPSFFEGLGISLIEAQVNGLPCFASNTIPKETNLQTNAFFLSLEQGAENWAEFIRQKLKTLKLEKRSAPKLAKNFDIKNIAKDLQDFYIKVENT